jgi:hypothetical protein
MTARAQTHLLAIALGLALAAASAAQAGPRRASDYGYVTAESRYGIGVIAAPVRRGPHGRLEVGLPGGTWIECGRSCRDTLRRETVDFWRNHTLSERDGPGYLRFEF